MFTITRLKVLIIDNNELQAKIFCDYILKKRHEAIFMKNYEEAITLIQQTNVDKDPFDLIFINFMPPGTECIKLCKTIKLMLPDVILVAITSYDDIETIKQICNVKEFDHTISKNRAISEVGHFLQIALSTKIQRLHKTKL